MATLQGKITDVTHKPPESLSSITVKAPSVRVGGGTDLIVSSPATVDFDRSTGDVTISGLTGGLSWLYLEGEGWSDSIALSVAEGMVSLVEAIANASSAPGIIDYLRLLADFKIRFDEAAQDAVDGAAEGIKWQKRYLTEEDQIDLFYREEHSGAWRVSTPAVATALNLPTAERGSFQVYHTSGATGSHANAVQMWLPSGTPALWIRTIEANGTGNTGWRNYSDVVLKDPRVPQIRQGTDLAWAVTDGDSAALGVTTSGDTIIPRIDTSTRKMLLDTLGAADALKRGDGNVDFYPWRVADEDGTIPLAIRSDGAIDFRRLTPETVEYLAGVLSGAIPNPTPTPKPDGGSPQVAVSWVPDVTAEGLHATHVPTGQRLLLSASETDAEVIGDAVTWHDGDSRIYRRIPTEGPFQVTDWTRMAWWGSSSMEGLRYPLQDMAAALGVTDTCAGGISWDRAQHILGRMGAVPFVVENTVTLPAGIGSEVYVTHSGIDATGGRFWNEARVLGVKVRHRMENGQFRLIRDEDGQDLTIPAGTPIIPDRASYRDAPTILQITKNSLSDGATGQDVLSLTKTATDWLETLPGLYLVLGNSINSFWEGDVVDRALEGDRLCSEHYGDRFIDLQAYVTSAEVWEHTGVTPTQDDLDMQASGRVPYGLAADGAHFDDPLDQAVAEHLIKPHIERLGWF